MLFPSSQEMRDADNETIKKRKITSFHLMQIASDAIAHEIVKQLPPSDIFFICGPGNNGGDGLCVAALFAKRGFRVRVHLIKDGVKRTEENKRAETLLDKCCFLTLDKFISELQDFPESVLIDAVLGIGQKNPPRDRYKDVISRLRFHKKIWCIDVPTGINVDTGEVFEPHFSCTRTFAVQANKRGLTQYPARLISGEITVVDAEIELNSAEFSLLEVGKIAERSPSSHKGDIGPVFLIAGSSKMPGALEFATEGALAGGASLVTAYDFSENLPPSVIRLSANEERYFTKKLATECIDKIKSSKSFVIGPGIGLEMNTSDFVVSILTECLKINTPGIVDADALTICANLNKHNLLKSKVITPHPGEVGSLLSVTTQEVQKDRFTSAKVLAKKTDSVVVIKGAGSIVYDPSISHGFVCLEGSATLGIGGSGDVMAGLIGALLGRGLSLLDATKLGVFAHAHAGSDPRIIFKSPLEIASRIHNELFSS